MKTKLKTKAAKPLTKIVHPGMMGDGTQEQNLNEVGDPSLRITKMDASAAFGKPVPKKSKA